MTERTGGTPALTIAGLVGLAFVPALPVVALAVILSCVARSRAARGNGSLQ